MTSPYPGFFLQTREGTERPTSWRGRRYWVLSRSLCGFRTFRLPNAARGDLRNFAAIKAREWAPFTEVGFHAHLSRDAARIWTWDAARVGDGMAATEVRPGRVTVLPETALQARAADGLRLIECVDGVEGQFWAEGELQASRWWPGAPSPQQWLEFQRASGIAVEMLGGTPPLEEPVWRGRPWTNSGEGLAFGIERRSREVVMVGIGLLLAVYAYVGGSLARDGASLSAVEDRLRSAEQRSGPVVLERKGALANQEFLGGFAKLTPYPPQLTLFARVAAQLPKNGARITTWSYQDGELQFTIASPAIAPDILFYVKTYSAVAGFTDVTADRADSDRSLRIKLRLARS